MRQADALAEESRRRLGATPQLDEWPPVSIVVVNRDGLSHLQRLFAGLDSHTDYPGFELILVDNASSDGSLEYARSVPTGFPISIVSNPHNETFSDACNQGAELAGSPLLLFLNNDIEPFEPGWLRELVACLQARPAGLAGSTLLRPAPRSRWGYLAQHRAIRIADADGMLDPDRSTFGAEPFDEGFGEDAETPAPAGACMLIERRLFRRVGGFTHGFYYGGEDIDLGLKVLSEGRSVLCSGRSLLIHRLGSTRREQNSDERQLAIGRGNRRLLWERWGPQARREYELDRLAGGGLWAAPGGRSAAEPPSREEALALGFCLKASEREWPAPVEEAIESLQGALARRGHRCAVLRGEGAEDLRGLNYDVAVHLRGPARYVPKPAQLNVLWAVSHLEALTPAERGRYDLVVSGTAEAGDPLIDAALARAEALRFPTRVLGARPRPCGKVWA